ncbi:MAG: electron transport complex subunit RsxA, partial [Clostridia bacterium]|nr:electron transport complex subunit RsxA [Clostridia bacterium]
MEFKELLLIAFAAIVTENFIFSRFLGICPFLGVSEKPSTAAGM